MDDVPVESIGANQSARLHLSYLDGLRGLAAIYVVLHHAYLFGNAGNVLSRNVALSTKWMLYGHYAVAVFIVLSGYSLMLPVAATGQLQNGMRGYLMRRARRILPGYYGALLVSLLLIVTVPILRHPAATDWDLALPALTPVAIGSHLVLLHNLSANWAWKINGPMWTVATEWQIYFLFAFFLLPSWRRLGIWPVVIGCWLATALPYVCFRSLHHGDRAHPWYLALFTLGMAAALVPIGSDARAAGSCRRWGAGTLAATICWLMVEYYGKAALALLETVIGIVTASLLVYLAHCHAMGHRSVTLRVLQSPVPVKLGMFSYSIYLIHYPLLAVANLTLRAFLPSSDARLFVLIGFAVPLCVALSYCFYVVCERPFLQRRQGLTASTGREFQSPVSLPTGSCDGTPVVDVGDAIT